MRFRTVGTVKQSIETRDGTWFAGNARQVGDAGFGRFTFVPLDRRLRDVDPEHVQLGPDPRGAPDHVGFGHLPDQILGLLRDRRATRAGSAGELGPVLAELPAPPSDHRGRLHDDEYVLPSGPEPGKPTPEEAVAEADAGPGDRPLVDGELVTKGENLDLGIDVGPQARRQDPQQEAQEKPHGGGP